MRCWGCPRGSITSAMNKKPVYYWQTDQRWKSLRFPAVGGTLGIGGGGCGATSSAMLIDTLQEKHITPVEAMQWLSDHKYLYANQGTSYDGFRPLFHAYGIECDFLTWTKCLSASSRVRRKVEQMLDEGYYFIALMTKGLWTSGGHYVVLWGDGERLYINDPASTRYERLVADKDTFFLQAKYFWWVDARLYNKGDEIMDVGKLIAEATPEQAYKLLVKAMDYANAMPLPVSWNAKEQLDKAVEAGITDGSRPMGYCTRLEAALMVERGRHT